MNIIVRATTFSAKNINNREYIPSKKTIATIISHLPGLMYNKHLCLKNLKRRRNKAKFKLNKKRITHIEYLNKNNMEIINAKNNNL